MKTHMILYLLIILFLNDDIYSKEIPNTREFGVALTTQGVGGRFSYNWSRGRRSMFALDIEIVGVKGENEFPITQFDQFGNIRTGTINDENLLLLPVMFGYRRFLWVDQIADNLRPFVQLSAGPIMAFDMIEGNNIGFFEQFSKGKAHYSVGAKINGGAVIQTSKRNYVSLTVGYSFLDFKKELDGRSNFNGFAFRAELGHWLR